MEEGMRRRRSKPGKQMPDGEFPESLVFIETSTAFERELYT
jgi:hypothetical protein